MDFITGFPRTVKKNKLIMVVVGNLSKASPFIPIKSTHKASDIAYIFIKEIFRLHELTKASVSYRDAKFTSKFWKGLFQELGNKLNFSTTYHPQTDGQTERVNQVLEDMLRMYVMDKPSKWEDYLHLVEFAYNNGHQASLGMSPFEALHGMGCINLANWDSPVNRTVLGIEMLKKMEQEIVNVKKNLKESHDKKKSYAFF